MDSVRSAGSGKDPLVVTVVGDLDVNAHESFLESFAPAFNRPDSRDVVLDVRGVTFVDSFGLRILIEAANGLKRHGECALTLRAPTAQLRRLLEVTGLTTMFAVE